MTHEQVYLIVSVFVIAGFIVYQAMNFPEWTWEAYIGLVISFSGAGFALLKTF